MTTTSLEKTNLEAHVDLCAERYKQLDLRLTTLESKVDSLHNQIQRSHNSINTVVISSAGTVIAGILGLIATILMKF
jgi:Mg2+ and Co2+ transporter CorA